MCAYLLLREQVIKPVLAGVMRKPGRSPAHLHPLDQHYVTLREELHRTFETIGLAASRSSQRQHVGFCSSDSA